MGKKWSFPPILTAAEFATANTYQADQGNLQRLFPCGTDTFTSYATNTERLGYCIHGNINNIHKICAALINKTPDVITGNNKDKIKEVINLFPPLVTKSIDQKLAIVIFILDICDDSKHIKDTFDLIPNMNLNPAATQTRNTAIANTINIAIKNAHNNEYNHRPVSASSVGADGDCVQTLYRHLINIAVQNHDTDTRKYNVGVLPKKLNEYYIDRYFADIIVVGGDSGESGMVDKIRHKIWNDKLSAVIGVGDTTIGSTQNIATVLEAVVVATDGQASVLGNRSTPFAHNLAVNGVTNAETARIQDALNNLDKRGNDSAEHKRFLVNKVAGTHAIATWANEQIEIIDNLRGRRILVGIGAAGHTQK